MSTLAKLNAGLAARRPNWKLTKAN